MGGVAHPGLRSKYTLDTASPQRLDSDGTYLLVTATFDHAIQVFRVATLSSTARPIFVGSHGRLNLPSSAAVAGGHLFIADTPFSRVLVWRNIEDALSGKWPPDILLGKTTMDDVRPQIGRERLFWPGGLSFDGTYLWVGEFKFSTRLLRFSPSPSSLPRAKAPTGSERPFSSFPFSPAMAALAYQARAKVIE